jgi:hypothetical protein
VKTFEQLREWLTRGGADEEEAARAPKAKKTARESSRKSESEKNNK